MQLKDAIIGEKFPLFTGKELDPETGLYYYGARYLDPEDGVSLPLPLGEYRILEREGRDGFYRLEAVDSLFGNDAVEGLEISQGKIRLHGPGLTYGCLAIDSRESFNMVADIINNTKKTKARVDYNGRNPFVSKETLVQFGTLKVIQSKEIEMFNLFAPRSATNKSKHQRMR